VTCIARQQTDKHVTAKNATIEGMFSMRSVPKIYNTSYKYNSSDFAGGDRQSSSRQESFKK
jgi:hypothetical protein